MKKLIIVGDGGHSKVIQKMINPSEYQLIEVWDDRYRDSFYKNTVLYRTINLDAQHLKNKEILFFIAIGDNFIREKITDLLNIPNERYASLHSPSAIICPKAQIDPGALIMAGAIVQTNSKIGKHAIVNTGSIIDHDCKLESFVHVAPGATLTGHCHLKKGVLVGAGSVMIPGTNIGANTTIGAGSIVTKNVAENQVIYGKI
ncbi:acetyltransferase [Listeria aquatica]|uniref:acetyltransferase n=1 Tax=Listeria aquatica TaxID=1494960 RepID=UPI003EF4D276